jgi:lipid-A-disaccharide synthase
MKPKPDKKCVMIIAGEASGDLHGANLVKALQARDPDIFFCGIGGSALEEAGVRIIVDASSLSVVGIIEVVSKGFSIWKGLSLAKQLLKSMKPDLLILIDFPDFNLYIAAKAKKLDVPVLYYISPQLWAWRAGRVKKIKKLVDHMAVILPFEADFYKDHGVPVTYVGHPLLDGDIPPPGTSGPDSQSEQEVLIGILPGSRDKEVIRNLPTMLSAAIEIQRKLGRARFVISHAPSVEKDLFDAIISDCGGAVDYQVSTVHVREVFKACRLVIAVSGTVTLEAAIWGTPSVIIYKLSPISYWLGRALVKVNHIGLVNLIAGRRVVPELVQQDASPANIAGVVLDLLEGEDSLETIKAGLAEARAILGEAGASHKVAEIALDMLDPNA